MTTRVQIPYYTDRWMMGDRYGVVMKVSSKRGKPSPPYTASGRPLPSGEIAYVKLDQSNKVVKVLLADCEVVR